MKNKIVFINDLHFGIPDTEREFNELQKTFIPFIKENPVDIIFLGGDYFDHKLSLAEPSVIFAFEFFNDLLNVCKEKNIKLRCIEGTQSHDRFQPRLLENFILDEAENKMIDFRFFETVGVEELSGMRVLYVPEEYPLNIDEYYAPYKEDKYDLMVIHGTWDFINFGTTVDNSRNDINTAPLFKYDEWKSTLEHGIALCGHIHGRHGFKTADGWKIIYPGSYTAWSFDQISERGFLYGECDTDTHKTTFEFINNPDSPKYANLDVNDLGLDLTTASIDDIKTAIAEQKNKVDFIKIDLNALSEDKKQILKEFYKGINGVKTEITKQQILLENPETKAKYEKYLYILKDQLPIEDVIKRFAKEEFGKDLTVDKIKEIITEEKS